MIHHAEINSGLAYGPIFIVGVVLVAMILGPHRASADDPNSKPIAQAIALPAGQGAILVPTLTDSINEPVWGLVNQQGKKISEHLCGQVGRAQPGQYVVLVGSGAGTQMIHLPVTVEAGKITRITPSWGALIIHIINENETTFRGSYELFEFSKKESYGIGRGAEEELGEKPKTWLLRPGFYKIVGPADGFRTIRNFTSVQISAGVVIHVVIVMDPTTNNFYGAGMVPGEDFSVKGATTDEIPSTSRKNLNAKYTVGGNVSEDDNLNNLSTNSSSIGFGIFSTLRLNYLKKKHFWNLFLSVEGGVRKNSQEGFIRKVKDQLELSTIYIYQVTPFWGPYLRSSLTSQLTTDYQYFMTPTVVDFPGSAKTPTAVSYRFPMTRGLFDPAFLGEGLGINVKLLKKIYIDVDARTGLGFRHIVTQGFWMVKDDTKTLDIVEFYQINPMTDIGGEAIVIPSARITRWVSYSGEYNAFYGGPNTGQYTMDNIFILHFTRSLSLAFLADISYIEPLKDRFQYSQNIQLKFSQSF
jgi:hypothetical protein